MKRFFCQLAGWILAATVIAIRFTCRVVRHEVPEFARMSSSEPVIHAIYHAHQLSGLMGSDAHTGVLVSRSTDGEAAVPLVRLSGHVPIRGSSGTGRKGGASALRNLCRHLHEGHCVALTIDGPRGPRGRVQRGVGKLAIMSDVAVQCVTAIPSRRWILSSTWDRFQIPKPFSRVDVYLAAPIRPAENETLDDFVRRIEQQLQQMELEHDRREAIHTDLRQTNSSLPTRAA